MATTANTIGAKLRSYLPSRGWSIFIGITSTITTLVVHDKYEYKRIRKEIEDKAAEIANQPLGIHEMPRKVTVYVAPGEWSKSWFNDYVKPVFDAAGMDYDLVTPDRVGEARSLVRELIWDGKKEHSAIRSRPLPPKPSGWAAWLGFRPATDDFGLIGNILRDLENRPKYVPEEGLVAVGPEAWTEMLQGVNDGCLTDRPAPLVLPPVPEITEVFEEGKEGDKKKKAAEDARVKLEKEREAEILRYSLYPPLTRDAGHLPPWFPVKPVGFVTGLNLIGWGHFPRKILCWFTARQIMREVGESALVVARDATRPMVRTKDVAMGSEYACAKADKEVGTEYDGTATPWKGPEDIVLDRLRVYATS
ncbi:mitochondrial import inner membrane translocase subunit tim54 [Irineochytrium annulatum]|nr:mitochondrial import inner membrane translocase subunit tim54 [Irineochytrium annulatum]